MNIGNWEVEARSIIIHRLPAVQREKLRDGEAIYRGGHDICLPGPLDMLFTSFFWADSVWFSSLWYLVATIWAFLAGGYIASRFYHSFIMDCVVAYLASAFVALLFRIHDSFACYRQYAKIGDDPPVVQG